jgi:ATP-dependent helicase HrpB
METKVGPNTKIEVVTEGILTRQLQSDPELKNIGLVIFDEFHERSIEADLGLALCLDIQEGLRDDLKLIIMSATLDGDKVSILMDHAPIITSQGQAFPVEKWFLPRKPNERIEQAMTSAILKALNEEKGSILAFLPGAGEIERTKKLLEEKPLGHNVSINPLYGMMNFADQDKAIKPTKKEERKVVLATAIAETSLTIEGIRIVIDSGLSRNAFYDTKSGMPGIETKMLSKASADQRMGRAGRLEAGVCYRLWSEAADRSLIPFTVPEIKRVDLTSLVLSLNQWGVRNLSDLKWLDQPDKAVIDRAIDLLKSLEALNDNGITAFGKKMASLHMHPRLSHMVIKAEEIGHGTLALYIAALLEERDILSLKPDQRTADLRLRIEALNHIKKNEITEAKKLGSKITVAKRILQQVKIWHRNFRMDEAFVDIDKTGYLVAVEPNYCQMTH